MLIRSHSQPYGIRRFVDQLDVGIYTQHRPTGRIWRKAKVGYWRCSAREDDEVDRSEFIEELRSIEVVAPPDSVLVGGSAQRVRLQEEYGVGLLAVRRNGERFADRLRDLRRRDANVRFWKSVKV